jgi:hypothetical protein
MKDETARYLWALRKVNDALIEGLKLAISVLEIKSLHDFMRLRRINLTRRYRSYGERLKFLSL